MQVQEALIPKEYEQGPLPAANVQDGGTPLGWQPIPLHSAECSKHNPFGVWILKRRAVIALQQPFTGSGWPASSWLWHSKIILPRTSSPAFSRYRRSAPPPR